MPISSTPHDPQDVSGTGGPDGNGCGFSHEPRGDLAVELVDGFPYPLLVTDATRRVRLANPASTALFGSPTGSRCCDLLGCGTANGPRGDACWTELALSSAEPLPEVRFDVPGRTSVWITAARAVGTRDLVVFELRPALPGDRRRRADPRWPAAPQLYIECLGKLRVEVAGQPANGPWLHQRPGQLLMLLVANRGQIVPTDRIAHLFWPHAGRDAVGNVRHLVHALRERLQPGRERNLETLVPARERGYTLQTSAIRIDADEFEQRAWRGLGLAHAGQRDAAADELASAVALYRGDFMADEPYLDFVLAERDRLLGIAARSLRALADLRREQRDDAAVTECLHRLADLEPYDLDAQRALIVDLLRHRRWGEAARRYELLRAAMAREFGYDLDFDLRMLAEETEAAGG